MAAYPDLPLMPGSAATPSQGADKFVDGAGGHKVYWPAQKMRFLLKHTLTTAQRDTLNTFYTTNKLLDVTLTWKENNQVYTVRFLEQPKVLGISQYPGHRDVTVEMGEV